MKSERLVLSLFLAVGLAFVAQTPAYAQAIGATANLTGQVTDSTGAVIPGVKLTLESAATGVTIEGESNEVGYYRFSSLRPDTYTLTVEQPGFNIASVENIILQVAKTNNINVVLEPSTVQEVVTVSAAAVSLNTQTSNLGEVVAERPVKQLPLILRDPTYLVNLVPGVTADHRSQRGGQDRNGLSWQGRLIFTSNGGMRSSTIAMVDGIDISVSTTGSGNYIPIQPTPDITQEFQLMTNNYSAEYGRGNSVLNIITKSGTNEYHGVVYEFHQNDNLNANDFFLNRAGQPKAESKRNQFGAAGGGPIVKNRAWFFGDFERMLQPRPRSIFTRVPTAREMGGDFSDLHTTAGAVENIYNPLDVSMSADGTPIRSPFPNNQIPASMINPFGPGLLPFWGSGPNNAGLKGPNGERTEIGNLQFPLTTNTSWKRWDIKGDYQATQNHRFMYRYSSNVFELPTFRVYGTEADNFGENNRNPGWNTVLSWSWTASPTMVITQGFNYSFVLCDSSRVPGASHFAVQPLGGPFNNPELLSWVNTFAGGTAFPAVGASGYASLGTNNTVDEPHHNFGYSVGIINTRGSHTLKIGFQGNVRDTNQRKSSGTGGSYSFSGQFTRGPNPFLPDANTGNGLADMLLGFPGGGGMASGFTTATRSKYMGWYFQDDWRVTPRLTLNLGVRYEFERPFTDRFDRFSRWSIDAVTPLAQMSGPNTGSGTLNDYFQDLVGRPLLGAVVWPSSPGYDRGIDKGDYSNLAPRLGFAYRLTDKLVMRGGLAKIYAVSPATSTVSAVGPPGNVANTQLVGSVDGINPATTIDDPFPAGFNDPIFDSQGLLTLVGAPLIVGAANGTTHTPYLWQWNFGFEYELGDQSVLSVAYGASRGRRMQCAIFNCGDQIAEKDFTRFRERVFESVPNPFFGIITDPTSPLSRETALLGQLLKQNPQFTGRVATLPSYSGPTQSEFRSTFESLQIGYKKSTRAGLSLQVAYTFSKFLTNVDSFEAGFLGPNTTQQNQVSFEGEKAHSAEDTTHRLVSGWVYELPFGRGQRFGSGMSPALDKIVGGWEVSGIMTVSSGFPLRSGVSPGRTGAFSDSAAVRPDLVGDACLSSGRSRSERISRWVDENAFRHPEPFTFGSAPRNLNCRGDGWKNFDISITKHIPIKESVRAEFRAEFFNAFNRVQFRHPSTGFGGGSFGQVTSQENEPRIIQIALKIHF